MQAHWPETPNDRDVRSMTEDELNHAIRLGMDDWCDLLDDLLNTGGMLPNRDLAGRVVRFLSTPNPWPSIAFENARNSSRASGQTEQT